MSKTFASNLQHCRTWNATICGLSLYIKEDIIILSEYLHTKRLVYVTFCMMTSLDVCRETIEDRVKCPSL